MGVPPAPGQRAQGHGGPAASWAPHVPCPSSERMSPRAIGTPAPCRGSPKTPRLHPKTWGSPDASDESSILVAPHKGTVPQLPPHPGAGGACSGGTQELFGASPPSQCLPVPRACWAQPRQRRGGSCGFVRGSIEIPRASRPDGVNGWPGWAQEGQTQPGTGGQAPGLSQPGCTHHASTLRAGMTPREWARPPKSWQQFTP